MISVKVTWAEKENVIRIVMCEDNDDALCGCFAIEDAVDFLKGVKVSLASKEKKSVPIKAKTSNGTFKWEITKKILNELVKPLETEVNIATGKAKRPEGVTFDLDAYLKRKD